jgi:hypothetical protein
MNLLSPEEKMRKKNDGHIQNNLARDLKISRCDFLIENHLYVDYKKGDWHFIQQLGMGLGKKDSL